jgi:molybdopterin-guanine dinucleotide biosynthesis protein A
VGGRSVFPAGPPPIWGLVLAGGESRRMGADKGRLEYHGSAQARWAWRLLADVCDKAYVSVRPPQARVVPYRDLPLIVDGGEAAGPAAGLAAAWRRHEGVAWLVLAVDMPLVDRALLDVLIGGRAPRRLATVFRHPDGILEPLCAIWEPVARETLRRRLGEGRASLRGLLETAKVRALVPKAAWRLANANSEDERKALRSAAREPK